MSPEEILLQGIEARAFPGATYHLEGDGRILATGAVGKIGYGSFLAAPVTPETVYDLASVTKIYTTAMALMVLDEQRLGLDSPVREFLPAFRPELRMRHLLQHTGGLGIEIQALHETAAGSWLDLLAQAPFRTPPGEAVRYSCSNFFVLARAIEAIAKEELGALLQRRVLDPLELKNTFMRVPEDRMVAPTERRSEGGFWCGTVHDEAARSWQSQTGGLCGNAGLFATVADVAAFGRAWFGDALLPESVRREVFQNVVQTEGGYRGMGWQVDVPGYMGDAPAGTGGHLGFTGPSLVVHPKLKAIAVILCNRVHPDRSGPNRLPYFQRIHSWMWDHLRLSGQ